MFAIAVPVAGAGADKTTIACGTAVVGDGARRGDALVDFDP